MTRGRKRQRTKTYPPGIDPDKLPRGAYWDPSGNGHWYTVYRDSNGKQRRRRIAGPEAKLSCLHRVLEEQAGAKRDSLRWVAEQFHDSEQFRRLAKGTRDDYEYCRDLVVDLPTRKSGLLLGDAPLARWDRPLVQRLVDQLTKNRGPSAANHALRWLRRVWRWGANRGHTPPDNPAKGIEAATERKRRRCPDVQTYNAVLEYARENGAPYLWMVMELAYLLRLRGIEVITLTDATAIKDGVEVNRRKGSRGNLTEWGPRLRAAWDAAVELRDSIIERRKMPTPMRPEERYLFLATRGGEPLGRSSLDSAWQRMIHGAMTATEDRPAVITEEQRFSLHDLKRAGITRTKGGRQAKLDGGGHRSEQMLDVYDQEVPRVRPTEE